MPTDPERFRPHFFVDERMRIRIWPEATARALGIPETRATGRSCWEVVGGAGCRACRSDARDVSPASRCARLPATVGEGGWLAWLPPARIAGGFPGSALHESLLLRGVLAESLAQHSLDDTLEAIRGACAADDCELFQLEPEGEDVVLRGCVGQDRTAFLERTRMPLGTGYPGWITATGKPLTTNEFQEDHRFQRESVKRSGIRTFIGVPLVDHERAMGYLGLARKDEGIPVDWGLHLLEAAHPIAVAAARPARGVSRLSAPRAPTIRCLGPFAIVGQARTLGVAAFPRRKALDLLRHLILARGTAMSRDALIEHLWPGIDPESGANRLHVALHALRSVLREALPGTGERLVQHRHAHYRIDVETLGPVDAFLFADALDEARRRAREGDPDGALDCLELALPLYLGELFADAEDVAFEAPRQRFRDRYREALHLLVDLHLNRGRSDAALEALARQREFTVFDSDWYDALVRKVVEHGRSRT
ncbi:MAG: GAF domain-containing protein [Burkholderiaceae bacterium]|nr:GAF domain-containing protein [Burkholderiaceae bacterium]